MKLFGLVKAYNILARSPGFEKAAEDCRTPGRSRELVGHVTSARFWSAAVLCRFAFVLTKHNEIRNSSHYLPHLPLLALGLFIAVIIPAYAAPLLDSDLNQIRFDQNIGMSVSSELEFFDETGKPVRLGEYFGKKPVVLVMGYYECPMLCTLVLNGMVECLGDMRWTIGKDYTLISVSIDPRETPALAAAKKKTYLKRYGRPEAEAGSHFLTGKADAVQSLANEIGFHYAYDPEAKQFAHPSGFLVLTPDGKIARYFFGVTFSPREVYPALKAASARTLGSRIHDLALLCFHYRPLTGRFSSVVMLLLRLGAAATVLALLILIVKMARREKRVVSEVAIETNLRA